MLATILVVLSLILLVLLAIGGLLWQIYRENHSNPPEIGPQVHFPPWMTEKLEKLAQNDENDEKPAENDEMEHFWPDKTPWKVQ